MPASKEPKKTAKKETEQIKKAAKKPVSKTSCKSELHIEFYGKSYTEAELVKIARDVWRYDLKKKLMDFKNVKLYVKPEESLCYYIINNEFTGKFAI